MWPSSETDTFMPLWVHVTEHQWRAMGHLRPHDPSPNPWPTSSSAVHPNTGGAEPAWQGAGGMRRAHRADPEAKRTGDGCGGTAPACGDRSVERISSEQTPRACSWDPWWICPPAFSGDAFEVSSMATCAFPHVTIYLSSLNRAGFYDNVCITAESTIFMLLHKNIQPKSYFVTCRCVRSTVSPWPPSGPGLPDL